MRATQTTNTNANMIISQQGLRKFTCVPGKGSREQHEAVIGILVIVFRLLVQNPDSMITYIVAYRHQKESYSCPLSSRGPPSRRLRQ